MELEHQFKRLEDAVQKEGAGDASALKLKNQQLTEELNEMYNHCAFRVDKGSSSAASPVSHAKGNEVRRSFGEQLLISENTYQIPIHIDFPGAASTNNSLLMQLSANRTMDLSRDSSTVASEPSLRQQVTSPQPKGAIINSVENFQILPKPIVAANQENVLKEPGIESPMKKSSTATLNKKEAQKHLELALPIAVAQNQSPPLKAATEASPKARKLPNGVVPIPESMNILLNNEEAPQDVKNSRYSNVGDSPIGPLPESGEHKDTNFLLNGNEVENGAHEVNDFNIVEDHHNHHDNIPEDEDKIVINNNAAEVEVHPGDQDEKEKRNELDLAIINRDLHGKDGIGHKKGNEDFVADQGFEDHMEEHVEEEDGTWCLFKRCLL